MLGARDNPWIAHSNMYVEVALLGNIAVSKSLYPSTAKAPTAYQKETVKAKAISYALPTTRIQACLLISLCSCFVKRGGGGNGCFKMTATCPITCLQHAN